MLVDIELDEVYLMTAQWVHQSRPLAPLVIKKLAFV
jgi:hypothetical protein